MYPESALPLIPLVNKKWLDKLLDTAQAFRKGPREKFITYVVSLLQQQRDNNWDGCHLKGVKNAKGLDVVEVPTKSFNKVFTDSPSRTKARKLIFDNGLAIKDGSYLTTQLADELNEEARCNCWHITEPDKQYDGKKVPVKLTSTNVELIDIEQIRKDLIESEGKAVDAGNIFRGVWALEAVQRGELEWERFSRVYSVSKMVVEGRVIEKGCRVYDAYTALNRDLRDKCFVNSCTGKGVAEAIDLNAAITITTRIAAIALGLVDGTTQEIYDWCDRLINGTADDEYKRIWEGIWTWDAHVNVYGGRGKWTKGVRNKVKQDVQVLCNADDEYIDKCKAAWEKRTWVKESWKWRTLCNQWALYNAIRITLPTLYEAIVVCRATGKHDAFFRINTLGEKLLMDTLSKRFGEQGIVVHRVHDALWSSDERLTRLGKAEVSKLVGTIIKKALQSAETSLAAETHGDYSPSAVVKRFLYWSVDWKQIGWAKENFN